MELLYAILADIVVAVHVAYVSFVVLGLVLILVGWLLKWRWVHNVWFRAVHAAMIGIVVVEAVLGIVCPLTEWEQQLRRAAGQTSYGGSFVGHWLHELLFFEAEPWVFTLAYCLFGALVLTTFWLVPPRTAHTDVQRTDR